MKTGDIVVITDGSYAVRLDNYELHTHIGLCRDKFKIICMMDRFLTTRRGTVIHDIHIQNLKTGAIYLHSSSFVRVNIANARLIAAAPELLEVIKYILSEYDDISNEISVDAINKAKDLVSKVEAAVHAL
jgi:hypothetical protein